MNTKELGLLVIEGVDAKKFLQGQLTANVDEITDTTYRLGAHCNPQGRILSLFYIFLREGKYYLLMPTVSIPDALNALKKYAIFFKVTLGTSDDISLMQMHPFDLEIPFIYPQTIGKFLPHEINLPELNGVSFNKGCYTGQEIIARMQYKGKTKTHLYSTQAKSDTTPEHGADIFAESEPAGLIVDFSKLAYNNYQLLVTAKENDVGSKQFFLDRDKQIPLELKAWQKN